jgi:hypothetical protein
MPDQSPPLASRSPSLWRRPCNCAAGPWRGDDPQIAQPPQYRCVGCGRRHGRCHPARDGPAAIVSRRKWCDRVRPVGAKPRGCSRRRGCAHDRAAPGAVDARPWMYQAGGRVGHTDGCARAATPGTSAQVWEAWVRATMVGAGSSRARRAGGGQKSLIRFKFRVYEGRCRYGHFSDKRHRAGYDDRR